MTRRHPRHPLRSCLTATLLLLTLMGTVWAQRLQVGLLDSGGAQGIQQALAELPDVQVQTVNALDEATLFRFDVVILGGVKGGIATRQWLRDVDLYVRCGGGMLLHHDSTGFRGWTDSPFPSLFKGTDRGVERGMVVVAQHPLSQGLPPRFEHAYSDHVVLDARPAGLVVIRNSHDQPVVVVGSHGEGRVVGNGMITGLGQHDGHQVQAPPQGGELALLLQAVRWLGESRLTALPAAELEQRKRQAAADLDLRQAAAMDQVDATGAGPRAASNRDWYTESMLTEQGFIHPPVHLLPGRFFMFDGMFTALTNRQQVGRELGEVRSLVQQMKWAGVTDIITHSGGPVMKFRYPTQIPKADMLKQSRGYGFDYLQVLCQAAHEEGLNVWGFWHPSKGGPYPIADPQGKPYGDLLDIKNPAVMQAARLAIDELAQRYNTHGNFKGVFLDELWHPFVYDRMEGQVEPFIAFCRERFGEAPPASLDLPAKLALGKQWHDPADKWWRRYVLFRNHFTVDFIQQVTRYANQRGLQTMPQIGFNFHWFHGHGDTYRLARAGNVMWTYEHRNNTRYEQYPPDRVITATHSRSPGGYQLVAHLRGLMGSQFALEQTWMPVGFGKNPRAVEIFARQVRTCREWSGSAPLTRVAVLTHRMALDLSQANAIQTFEQNEEAVQLALCNTMPAAMLMVQDSELMPRYPVLVAPQFATQFLPAPAFEGLGSYVQNGGRLIMLGSSVSTAREDHTEVVDRSPAFTGVKAGEPATAQSVTVTINDTAFTFAAATVRPLAPVDDQVQVLAQHGGQPLITSRAWGKGRVVTVGLDVAALLQGQDTAAPAAGLLAALIASLDPPPIRVEGELLTFSALRKGNWVVVSFLPPGSKFDTTQGRRVPVRARLRVDMKQLGIEAQRFKVINLARDREMMPQGRDWDFFGRNYWTQQSLLQEGVEIFMPPDSLEALELPTQTTDDYVRRFIVPRWPSQARAYEHDIIAIAPAADPFPLVAKP